MKAQRAWRIAGAACLVLCALMAWHGVALIRAHTSALFLIVYWGAFLVFLIVVFAMALLDMRYTRVQYALEQRRIFHETIGHPTFRHALRSAQKEQRPIRHTEENPGESPDLSP